MLLESLLEQGFQQPPRHAQVAGQEVHLDPDLAGGMFPESLGVHRAGIVRVQSIPEAGSVLLQERAIPWDSVNVHGVAPSRVLCGKLLGGKEDRDPKKDEDSPGYGPSQNVGFHGHLQCREKENEPSVGLSEGRGVRTS
jgi:hypothetical protein